MIGRADKANSGSPFLFCGALIYNIRNFDTFTFGIGLQYKVHATYFYLALLPAPHRGRKKWATPISSESPFLALQAFFSLCQAEGFLGAEKKFILASPAHSAELKMSQGRGRLLYDICKIVCTLRSPLSPLAVIRMQATHQHLMRMSYECAPTRRIRAKFPLPRCGEVQSARGGSAA